MKIYDLLLKLELLEEMFKGEMHAQRIRMDTVESIQNLKNWQQTLNHP